MIDSIPTGIFRRSYWSLVTIILCLAPLWVHLEARAFLSPEGFFREFLVSGFGLWIFAVVQILLLSIMTGFLYFIWVRLW